MRTRAEHPAVLGVILPGFFLLATLTLRNDGILFPDGTLQTTAAPSNLTRSYYLTISTADGATMLSACGDGFHSASFREISNTSYLRYAANEPDARTAPDSGLGPPANRFGWVGTGVPNCNGWQSNDPDDSGILVSLPQDMENNDQARFDVGLWETNLGACNQFLPVWCVEN